MLSLYCAFSNSLGLRVSVGYVGIARKLLYVMLDYVEVRCLFACMGCVDLPYMVMQPSKT